MRARGTEHLSDTGEQLPSPAPGVSLGLPLDLLGLPHHPRCVRQITGDCSFHAHAQGAAKGQKEQKRPGKQRPQSSSSEMPIPAAKGPTSSHVPRNLSDSCGWGVGCREERLGMIYLVAEHVEWVEVKAVG